MAEAVKPKSKVKKRTSSKRKTIEPLLDKACDSELRFSKEILPENPVSQTTDENIHPQDYLSSAIKTDNAQPQLATDIATNNNAIDMLDEHFAQKVITTAPKLDNVFNDDPPKEIPRIEPEKEFEHSAKELPKSKEKDELEQSLRLIEFSSGEETVEMVAPVKEVLKPEKQISESASALQSEEEKQKLQEDTMNKNDIVATEQALPAEPMASAVLKSKNAREHSPSHERVQHRRLYPKLPKVLDTLETIRPFTETQLMSLYYNPELEENEEFIDHFIQQYQSFESHEFYELLMGYLRSRRMLTDAVKDVTHLQREYESLKDRLWEMLPASVSKRGTCADGTSVEGIHHYEKAVFDEKTHMALTQTLQQLRELSHETCSHHLYSVQLAHLQVDLYIYKLLSSSPALREIPSNAPVTGFLGNTVPPNLRSQLDSLKVCISILFAFQRRPISDRQFIEDTRQWLTRLVAVLLRTASLEDHLFILNHILRCPAGIGSWATAFVQPPHPPPWKPNDELASTLTFGSPLLDHAVTVLATLLVPIKGREQFLEHLKAAAMAHSSSVDSPSDSLWVYIDSDGDDDEDVGSVWSLWQESDIVSLLNQIPIPMMFRHVLLIEQKEDVDHYDVNRSTEQSMMKLLAFATQLMYLFREGLKTFNSLRYKQLTKRLSRLVRHTVKFVSDHWLNFRQSHRAVDSALMLRLQVEFDQFFMRAVNCIFSSQKLGAWQFMAALPFKSVSSPMMWRLLWLLHNSYQEHQEVTSYKDVEFRAKLQDQAVKLLFEEKLSSMAESEVYYLISAFEHMAASRDDSEVDFVSTVATEIFEIAFVNTRLRDNLSKDGRDILAQLATKHPFIMSVLLKQVESHADKVGSMSLYLFRNLPLKMWTPTQEDMSVIKSWLLQHSLGHPCNQLARLILINLNWGVSTEGTELYLDKDLHRQVALMLVEGCAQFGFNSEIGSLVSWSFHQVSQLASSMWYRAATSSDAVGFATWAWEVLLTLRLHALDHPNPQWENLVDSGTYSKSADLSDIPNFKHDSSLHVLYRKVEENHPAACYVALTMTTSGHSIPSLVEEGLKYFSVLVNSGQYSPAIHALFCTLPLFYKQAEPLLNDQKFLTDMQSLLTADLTYLAMAKSLVVSEFPGKILQQLMSMIRFQIEMSNQLMKDGDTISVVFWLKLLLRVLTTGKEKGGWFTKRKGKEHTFYLLDNIIKQTFFYKRPMPEVKAELENAIQALRSPSSGVMASFLSFVSGHGQDWPSILPHPSLPSCPWFSWIVLDLETRNPQSAECYNNVLQEMLKNPRVNPDIAIKRTSGAFKFPCADFLPIYRWANHAVDVPLDHPILPFFWQEFFRLYLKRVPVDDDKASESGSIGRRFFESANYFGLLKRMKKRLNEAADYHHRCVVQLKTELEKQQQNADSESDSSEGLVAQETEDLKISSEINFHQQLTRLLRTFSLWLEEPRLHEGMLCVKSLPPQYDPELLNLTIADSQEYWFQFVNTEMIQSELRDMSNMWHQLKPSLKCYERLIPPKSSPKEDPVASILANLRKYEDPLPPPNIPPLKPPVLTLMEDMLSNRPLLMATLENDFKAMCDQARTFVNQISKHVALDCAFTEILPTLYRNIKKDITLKVPCEKENFGEGCSGAATIHVEIEEGCLNDRVQVELEQNRRDQYILVSSLLEVPPQNVCSSAVRVENFITMLVNRWKEAKQTGFAARILQLKEIGVTLFYFVMSEIDEVTRMYSPTRQFLASCLDVLGQEFIQDDGEQCLHLLKTIISEPSVVGLVTPLFNPGSASGNIFIEMYEILTEVQKPSLTSTVFVLLSKFDLMKWLRSSSTTISHRRRLLEVTGRAILSFGLNPDVEKLLIFDMYRNHLQTIIMYDFPEHYGDTLHFLLQGMDSLSLNVEVWYDFLRCLGFTTRPSASFRDQTKMLFQKYALNQFVLQELQLEETLRIFGSHFKQQRKSSSDLRKYGLYSKYGPYLNPVGIFFGLIGHSWIFKVTLANGGCDDTAYDKVWRSLQMSFDPWLAPMNLDERIMQPWLPDDAEEAGEMLNIFISCLLSLHECLQGSSTRSVLSFVWDYYLTVYAQPYVHEHVLTLCSNAFLILPWDMFLPTPTNMEVMTKVIQDYPLTLTFVCNVFLRVPWVYVIDRVIQTKFPDEFCNAHIYLAKLLVVLAFEPSVSQARSFLELVNSVENLSWHLVGAQPTTELLNTFSGKCNPTCIFDDAEGQDLSKPIDLALLRFLKNVSGIAMGITGPQHPEIVQKRAQYIHMCTHLITRCASENPGWLHTKAQSFRSVVCRLLAEAENAISAYVPLPYQFPEGVAMVSQILNLTSNASQKKLQTLLLEGLLQWIKTRPGSLLLLPCLHAAGLAVNNMDHLTTIVESCISSYCALGVELLPIDGGWSQVVPLLQIPELTKMEFLAACSREGAYLTMHAYLLQRLPVCRSLEEELTLLMTVIEWCSQVKPGEEGEPKLLLLWDKVLELSLRQMDLNGNVKATCRVLGNFCATLNALAEDRQSTGLLGAVGLGKRSPFTTKTRFMSRAMASFILMQMPLTGPIRTEGSNEKTKLPSGDALNSKESTEKGETSKLKPSQQTVQSLTKLENLRTNKQYIQLKDYIEHVLEFIWDPKHSLSDARSLLQDWAISFYPEKTYLRYLTVR